MRSVPVLRGGKEAGEGGEEGATVLYSRQVPNHRRVGENAKNKKNNYNMFDKNINLGLDTHPSNTNQWGVADLRCGRVFGSARPAHVF